MFRRFIAGSAIGAILIAVAALLVLPFAPAAMRTGLLTRIWCFVPAIWGIWTMLTPQAWLPERLPVWGAILGLLGGITNMFVLNVPARVFQTPISVIGRIVAVVVAVAAYYFLWMLVRATYRIVVASDKETTASSPSHTEMRKAA